MLGGYDEEVNPKVIEIDEICSLKENKIGVVSKIVNIILVNRVWIT